MPSVAGDSQPDCPTAPPGQRVNGSTGQPVVDAQDRRIDPPLLGEPADPWGLCSRSSSSWLGTPTPAPRSIRRAEFLLGPPPGSPQALQAPPGSSRAGLSSPPRKRRAAPAAPRSAPRGRLGVSARSRPGSASESVRSQGRRMTSVPLGMISNNSSTSSFRSRIQPSDAIDPIVSGSQVPWIPRLLLFSRPIQRVPRGFSGSP